VSAVNIFSIVALLESVRDLKMTEAEATYYLLLFRLIGQARAS
jgi:hypothetical protein